VIVDPLSSVIVDEVLAVFMRAPNSYTCEDVVEIQSHAGPLIIKKILTLVIDAGARLAEPGEFTRRAFLNGRIDLSQAESVAEMINARTDAALSIAARQLGGEMGALISQVIELIQNSLVLLQAGIEFEEDVETPMEWSRFLSDLELIAIQPIQKLLGDYANEHVMRDGIRLNIIGRPNVGKSSLLNRLLKKDKAIVTPIPGTTRDLIEDFFTIRGIPILITDTAGWHATDDPVESIGIERTRRALTKSDLIVFVIEATEPFVSADMEIMGNVDISKTILAINKIDLLRLPFKEEIPTKLANCRRVEISAKTGQGLETLKDAIAEHFLGSSGILVGNSLVPSTRQKKLLENALRAMERIMQGVPNEMGDELVVYELEEALEELQRINGEVFDDKVMDEIFSRFCIGK
jgi:tRNA modification GTPase